jgi:cysteine synthase A
VGLALVARVKGYRCIVTMPASIAKEKVDLMRLFGAEVHLQPSVPFRHPDHYFQVGAPRGS